MKSLGLFLVLWWLTISLYVQKKEFVCPPCGRSCDQKIHANAGTCSTCRMELVEKAKFDFPNLSYDQFCARIAANPQAVLLDVRSKSEFEGTSFFQSTYGHFKNAININIDDLETRVGELEKYKSREILIYCSHSVRSPRAAIFLKEKGFINVANMAGGVSTIDPSNNECLAKHYVVHR